MRTIASVELDAGSKTFASGLLSDLIAALRRSRKGDLVAVISTDPGIGSELEAWCRFTRNSLVETAIEEGHTRWVLRYGEAPENVGDDRPVGSRLWLYTNFDCNLSCDYCCVRSSPKTPRRALGRERVRRIAAEAAELGVREIFVTGGEPFMLPDIGEIVGACAAAAPTTILTNGMLFAGSRLEALRSFPRERVTFQISLDSPTPERHDSHRGQGTWARAWKGIEFARAEGFRVRLAATVSTDLEADEFRMHLPRRSSGERGGPGHQANCAARLGHAGRCFGESRPGARGDDYGGRRVLASGRSRGRRSAGQSRDLPACPVLCGGAPRVRSRA